MIARAARLALPFALSMTTGCYWSSQPAGPYRSVALVLRSPAANQEPSRPIASPRLIVLGRFDTVAQNPIGGLYDHDDYAVTPLSRTYFFKDGAVVLFEAVAERLRSQGLTVWKDYAGRAEAPMLEPPLRERRPLLVNATVTSLQHDQIRSDGDFNAALVTIDVRVTETDGTQRLAKTYQVERTRPYDTNADFLRDLGRAVADTLSADDAFRRAIEAES